MMRTITALGCLVGAAESLTTSQLNTIKSDLAATMFDGRRRDPDKIGGAARLPFHDAYGQDTKMNGCLDPNEKDHNGLESVRAFIDPICETHVARITTADCWALAGQVAFETADANSEMPPITFRYGRTDSASCSDHAADGTSLLPAAAPGGNPWTHILDVFQTRGQLSTKEIVALMGAHALGRPSSDDDSNSGFDALTWVRRGDVMDNTYFSSIAGRGWRREPSRLANLEGQWIGGPNIMLDTDMALVIDVGSCEGRNGIRFGGDGPVNCNFNEAPKAWVDTFGSDQSTWLAAFAIAYQKMVEVGYSGWTRGGAFGATTLCEVTATSSSKTCTPPAPAPTPAVSCPDLSSPAGATAASCHGYTAGQVCTFACNSGFVPNNQASRTCGTDGAWSGSNFVCTVQTCPDLSAPNNAETFTCRSSTESQTCAFRCNTGYEDNGQLSRVCTAGAWSGSALICSPRACSALSAPAGATGGCTSTGHGESCSFTCVAGFTAKGDGTRECQFGAWGGIPLSCDVVGKCPTLEPPAGSSSPACAGKSSGDTCTMACDTGYRGVGDAFRTCTGSTWSSGWTSQGTSVESTCQGSAEWGEFGLTYKNITTEALCKQECEANSACAAIYWQSTREPAVCHLYKGCSNKVASAFAGNLHTYSSGTPLACSPISCDNLDVTSVAGAVRSTFCENKVHGDTCSFACATGYTDNGCKVRTCTAGNWTGCELACSPKHCPTLQVPANADGSTCTDKVHGETCSFSCKTGFSGVGSVVSACTNGEWSAPLQCIASTQRYVYQASSWGPCSADCGPGTRMRTAICVDTQDGNKEVMYSLCLTNVGHNVTLSQSCQESVCSSYAWAAGEFGACSQDCNTGTRSRVVHCTSTVVNGPSVRVDDARCEALTNKPVATEACNTSPCAVGTFTWVTGAWSTCSATCGGGSRTRTLQCRDHQNLPTLEASCAGATKPALTEDCGAAACERFSWFTCPFEPCTAECGGAGGASGNMAGTQQRAVFCRNAGGQTVDESKCTGTKPDTSLLGCNPQACSDFNWMTTEWAACGASASLQQTRTYHCHAADGANAIDSDCPADKTPADSRSCAIGRCPSGESLSAGHMSYQLGASLLLLLPLVSMSI